MKTIKDTGWKVQTAEYNQWDELLYVTLSRGGTSFMFLAKIMIEDNKNALQEVSNLELDHLFDSNQIEIMNIGVAFINNGKEVYVHPRCIDSEPNKFIKGILTGHGKLDCGKNLAVYVSDYAGFISRFGRINKYQMDASNFLMDNPRDAIFNPVNIYIYPEDRNDFCALLSETFQSSFDRERMTFDPERFIKAFEDFFNQNEKYSLIVDKSEEDIRFGDFLLKKVSNIGMEFQNTILCFTDGKRGVEVVSSQYASYGNMMDFSRMERDEFEKAFAYLVSNDQIDEFWIALRDPNSEWGVRIDPGLDFRGLVKGFDFGSPLADQISMFVFVEKWIEGNPVLMWEFDVEYCPRTGKMTVVDGESPIWSCVEQCLDLKSLTFDNVMFSSLVNMMPDKS